MMHARHYLLITILMGIIYFTKATNCRSTLLGQEYDGDTSMTISGHDCQPWSSNTPHSHLYTVETSNYCRNSKGWGFGPWCLTMDSAIFLDQCDTPRCGEISQTASTFFMRQEIQSDFNKDALIDNNPATCQLISKVTDDADLVLRADLGLDADKAAIEIVANSVTEQYLDIIKVYSNIGNVDLFNGYFEYCEYRGLRSSSHVTHAKLYYYCDCPSSACRYIYFRVPKGEYHLDLCEIHVAPNVDSLL